MKKIVSLAKRRGFLFPGSEISGGLTLLNFLLHHE